MFNVLCPVKQTKKKMVKQILLSYNHFCRQKNMTEKVEKTGSLAASKLKPPEFSI